MGMPQYSCLHQVGRILLILAKLERELSKDKCVMCVIKQIYLYNISSAIIIHFNCVFFLNFVLFCSVCVRVLNLVCFSISLGSKMTFIAHVKVTTLYNLICKAVLIPLHWVLFFSSWWKCIINLFIFVNKEIDKQMLFAFVHTHLQCFVEMCYQNKYYPGFKIICMLIHVTFFWKCADSSLTTIFASPLLFHPSRTD